MRRRTDNHAMEEKETKPEVKPEADKSLLEQTIEAAKVLKEANAERKALLDREEAMKSLEIIGGKSAGGTANPPQKDPELEKREMVLAKAKGTLLEAPLRRSYGMKA